MGDLQDANKKYWMQINSNAVAWEATTQTILGKGLMFKNDLTGGNWVNETSKELVYSLICEEIMATTDMYAYDFSYSPNPVKNELNIFSKTLIERVTIYNMAGQQVTTEEMNTNHGKVNTKELSPGVYLFKVLLEKRRLKLLKLSKNSYPVDLINRCVHQEREAAF